MALDLAFNIADIKFSICRDIFEEIGKALRVWGIDSFLKGVWCNTNFARRHLLLLIVQIFNTSTICCLMIRCLRPFLHVSDHVVWNWIVYEFRLIQKVPRIKWFKVLWQLPRLGLLFWQDRGSLWIERLLRNVKFIFLGKCLSLNLASCCVNMEKERAWIFEFCGSFCHLWDNLSQVLLRIR